MNTGLRFEIVSPEKLLKDSQAAHVVVPGLEGDFGVLPQHAPMMSTLRPGVIEIFEEDGKSEKLFVKGGLAQISMEGLTILAEEVIDLASVDKEQLIAQIRNTREDIEDTVDEIEKRRLTAELNWMQALQDLAH